MLWGVKFPFHYSNIKQRGYIRYIHIGMVLTALLLPCVSVGIVFGTEDFTLMDFPPSVCTAGDPDVSTYAIVLPFSILMAGGISLIAVILQELVLVRRLNVSFHRCDVCIYMYVNQCIGLKIYTGTKLFPLPQQRHIGHPSSHLKGRKRLAFSISQFTTPELKVLIIFIYYFAIAAFALVAFTELAIIGPEFEDDLGEYFACEATGLGASAIPGKDCSRPQDRLGGVVVRTLSRSLLGLYPIVNLIYVVNVKELKQKFLRCKAQQNSI